MPEIFGFKVNSFEQLCVHIANENLLYFFNEHVFRKEDEEISHNKMQTCPHLIEIYMDVSYLLVFINR